MKSNLLKRAITGAAVVVGCFAVAAASADPQAGKVRTTGTTKRPVHRVILVTVTGSNIPQRVVKGGHEINTANRLSDLGARTTLSTGAGGNVNGMLSNDPDISFPPQRR